ncbi:Permease YjgP/YjgQ family protein [uncultured Paludibacter sp.]|uniref:Permease YjgP/YjgQ family protein n=1 Tax=uncultured Paludibacter sp. TaxID=497635 RepID=A0A653AFU6_9BACT|nr:Permease YjgP/YjgQ family protein [uncultured Paludibacter sp.]
MNTKINYQKIGLKRIDTYIIKKFLGTFFFTIILILSISIVFDITEKIDNFYENNAPWKAIIFDYYLNFIPFYAHLFTPLFTFISVIFFTSKMANNTEIVAILASGVSFKRFLLPYAISAAVIMLFSFVLGAFIIPHSSKIKLDFENKYVEKFKTENAHNIQMEVEKGTILYFDRFEETNNTGYKFSLEKFDKKILISRLTAESVIWDSAYNWHVNNYIKRDFNGMRETLTRGDTLNLKIPIQPKELFISAEEAPQMSLFELRNYLQKQKKRGVGNTQVFEDEYYKRYSMPLAAIIMTLIGVTLSSKKVRGGMGLNLGIGLALSSLYVLFITMSSTFAVSGLMPTLLAVWMPNIVFLSVGLYLYRIAPK